MSTEYSLCPQSTVYVRTVYVIRVQFMSTECSLCPKSTVYVHMVQFMCPECFLFPKSTVFVLRLQFIEIMADKATNTKTECIRGIYV